MRRTVRQNSNIFEMFTPQQIVELRETFNLLDTNADTTLSKNDLTNFLASIGNPFTKEEIDEMMVCGDMGFMLFLTMLGEKLSMVDDERILRKAFNDIKETMKKKDYVDEKELKILLMTDSDLTEEDCDRFLKGSVDNGRVDIEKLICIMKHGEIINKNE